jgi:hypothetical protein
MVEIKTDKDLRSVRNLSFCYLCGEEFQQNDIVTKDHVPPKAVFLSQDRTRPLILPTHERCNQEQSITDEIVGQLISALNNKYPDRKNMRVKISIHRDSAYQVPFLFLEGIDMRIVLIRWLRAFHAALYKEYLPTNTPNVLEDPLPRGRKENGKVKFDKIGEHLPLFVQTIKKNRKAGRIDRIECFNGKCIYECTWETTDDGRWSCFFALKIYDWENLGDKLLPKRGCVGWYMPSSGKPKNASEGVTRLLEIPCRNTDKLDPFGQ